MKKKLTNLQAYNAMLHFLRIQYDLSSSEYIGDILSNCEFWPNKRPGDPAMWKDWKKAIKVVCLKEKLSSENKFTIQQSFDVMFSFIEDYIHYYNPMPQDYINLLNFLKNLKVQADIKNPSWIRWIEICNKVKTLSDPRVYLEFV